MTDTDTRAPVSVLTGFLGAGKTTLLNRILTEDHGKRVAVIVNEFGEVGIDQELVIGADEEIFEMNNGCICCTVRGDLIRILGNLMKRKDSFDYVLIETTGLADPGPVAQTFFVDDEMQAKLRLDAIVTVVDAKHAWQQLDESPEAASQLAFADVIVLNKTDLVTADELERLESRVRAMNVTAGIHRTRDAGVELGSILDVGGFDLDRALDVNPAFLEPEYPFEWGGAYELAAGGHELVLGPGPDPTMDVALVRLAGSTADDLTAAIEPAVLVFAEPEVRAAAGGRVEADGSPRRLELDGDGEIRFTVLVDEPGAYALFTQHRPEEFAGRLEGPTGALSPAFEHVFNPDHEHDDSVTSVAVTVEGELDSERFNRWLQALLAERGVDLYRTKGILALAGRDERFVFQGVHMLTDGQFDRPWGAEPRRSSLVFIGRDLDAEELTQGFRACLA